MCYPRWQCVIRGDNPGTMYIPWISSICLRPGTYFEFPASPWGQIPNLNLQHLPEVRYLLWVYSTSLRPAGQVPIYLIKNLRHSFFNLQRGACVKCAEYDWIWKLSLMLTLQKRIWPELRRCLLECQLFQATLCKNSKSPLEYATHDAVILYVVTYLVLGGILFIYTHRFWEKFCRQTERPGVRIRWEWDLSAVGRSRSLLCEGKREKQYNVWLVVQLKRIHNSFVGITALNKKPPLHFTSI